MAAWKPQPPERSKIVSRDWPLRDPFEALSQELPSGPAAVALNPGIIDTERLQSTFGGSSSDFPAPATWTEKAVPFLEKFGPRDNGKALTAPQG